MKLLKLNNQGLLKLPDQGKWVDDNEVYSFKKRTIDVDKPIRIYRNLNKKGIWYSIVQSGYTVAHATAICLHNCKFIVNQKTRLRILKTKHKEAHAFVEGMYSISGMGTSAKKNDLPAVIKYNPYHDKFFTCINLTTNPFYVDKADFVMCNGDGVKAAYITKKQ